MHLLSFNLILLISRMVIQMHICTCKNIYFKYRLYKFLMNTDKQGNGMNAPLCDIVTLMKMNVPLCKIFIT